MRGVYYNPGIVKPNRTYRYVADAISVKGGYTGATGVVLEQPTASDSHRL